MRKHLKIAVCITLIAMLIFTAITLAAAETDDRELYYNEDFIYEILSNDTITIHYYIGNTSQVIIPSHIDGLPVVSIEKLAFYGTSVKDVYISEGITTLKEEAFFYCHGLESVTLPSTLSVVEQGVFRYCRNLKTVTFSGNISTLSNYMFYGCLSLESINLSDSVTNIPVGAFSYCQNLKQISLPENLDTIYDYAFYNCGLEVVKLPRYLQNIHQKAFAESISLAEIISPNTKYTFIAKDAFENCIADFPYYSAEEYPTDPPEPSVNHSSTTVPPPPYVGPTENTTEPTDKTPSGDTITVYFSNSQHWTNVNIHYWGGEKNTIWPGYEMEFVENNIYGQDVYKYTIPADTTGIVFNEGTNMAQTVDVVTDIIDGHGFYPTETENGKWKVKSYIYGDTETSTRVIPTEYTEPNPTESYVSANDYYIGDFGGFLLYEDSKISSASDTVSNNRKELLELAWNVRAVGDANNDGKVNIKDATQIQRYVASIISANDTDFNYKNSDVDTDGKITVRDATAIQKFVAGLIDSLY